MSHSIAEEQKTINGKRFYLDISHSGGITRAEIVYCDKNGWRTYFKEDGRKAEENARYTWERL